MTFDDLLSGKVESAVIVVRGAHVAWTKTWQGPGRPDHAAALADLMDHKAEAGAKQAGQRPCTASAPVSANKGAF